MFCVECGTEGPVYEGLCAKCFRKKYPVVQPIELLDVARCESCGSYRLRPGWSKVDRELALPQILREAMPPLAPYERVGFTQVTRDEDANNLALTVKAVGRFQDLAVLQDFHVRVRIKPSLCDSCQKQRGLSEPSSPRASIGRRVRPRSSLGSKRSTEASTSM